MPEPSPVQPLPEPESLDDARLLRRTGWRLVAWSGGSTLLVLLVLGVALYAAVANTLASASLNQLSNRIDPATSALEGHAPDAGGPPTLGFLVGRGNTFLFAFDNQGKAVQLGREPVIVLPGLPQSESIDAARQASDGEDVWTGDLDVGSAEIPVRVLTQRVTYHVDGQTYFLQALQDRSTEVETLQTLLVVLLVGGVIVVLVAVGFGAFYARRALVPIRDSLAGQRAALHRQREFAADASHELRTPLTVIRSSVEHLRRHAAEPVGKVGDALDDIDLEVAHLTDMVGDLLLLARSDSGVISLESIPMDLDDVAAEAAAGMHGPAEASGVRLVVDPEPAPMLGDPMRLRQLVTALADNAIRHSPAGGEVRVTVRRTDDLARLTVEDQGPGIRPEDLPRVFDRFWRAADAPSGGTGLGLSIAKWICDQHGGRITAANRPEGGARFDVELPARRPSVPPPAPELRPFQPQADDSPDPSSDAREVVDRQRLSVRELDG
jgi:signal transduction histidine kinase